MIDFDTKFKAIEKRVILPSFGKTVTYKRGSDSVDITAIQEKCLTRYDPETGVMIAVGDAAFSFHKTDLIINSVEIEPALYDQIISGVDTYEVVEVGDLDGGEILRTVPVRKVDY